MKVIPCLIVPLKKMDLICLSREAYKKETSEEVQKF